MKTSGLSPYVKLLLPPVLILSAIAARGATADIEADTDHAAIAWRVEKDGRLNQRHLGARPATSNACGVAYPAFGNGFPDTPALRVTHADGNTSTELAYVSHEVTRPSEGITLTRIELKDRSYSFFVTLCCRAHAKADILELWTEIRHEESGPVMLWDFASTAPIIPDHMDTLTQFSGPYSAEAVPTREKLTPGVKIIESKLCSRAHMDTSPMFLLSHETPQEESGEVIGATLAWSGNFQFAFNRAHKTEIESQFLRAVCGMNPYASQYRLAPMTPFITPPLMLGYSATGMGNLSRNFHRFARQNILRDGARPRAILLNNWEATGFDFDEKKLLGLFDSARDSGLEMFLLDDGWFGGSKYPRKDASVGLGDWLPAPNKLPHGVEALAQEAVKRGLRFGIWLEPEMANLSSEVFEKHPDWVLRQPTRPFQFYRNNVVLDLCNPAVEEYVFKCVDDLLAGAPDVSYIKWDCNSMVRQPGSPSLGAQEQSHLFIGYNLAIYRIMDRIAKKHSKVEMMVCAGGGGRTDFGSLRYFHEFWPSDNTDPLARIRIQRGYSTFFPAISQSCHVTHTGGHPLKFTFDVAMSGRLGVDMDLQKLSPADKAFCASAIAAYKGIREVVQFGDQYRLENADENGVREAIAYVSENKSKAALMVYQITDAKDAPVPVKLNGLDPAKSYRLKEINVPVGATARFADESKVVSGKALMEAGITPPCRTAVSSMVITLTAE